MGIGESYVAPTKYYKSGGHLLVDGNALLVDNPGIIMRPSMGMVYELMHMRTPILQLGQFTPNLRLLFGPGGWLGNTTIDEGFLHQLVPAYQQYENSYAACNILHIYFQ